jgi:hypothetical protein
MATETITRCLKGGNLEEDYSRSGDAKKGEIPQ